MRISVLALSLITISVISVHAEDTAEQLHAIQAQLERISQLVTKQQRTIEEQQQELSEQKKLIVALTPAKAGSISPSTDVFRRIEKAEQQSAQAVKIAGRKKPNDLNMSIGAAIDTSYRYFDGDSFNSDRAAGHDFAVRGAELVLFADVDPNFKTYMVLNAVPNSEDNDEAVPTLEEAAIYTTSLKNMQVKGGRFFVPFGRFSMFHEHDLPFVTRPGSIENYVGGESGGDGVQIQGLVPINHFLQLTGGVFNKIGGEFPLRNTAGDRRNTSELTYFAKALTSFDIHDDHTIETGLSTIEVPDHLIHRNLTDLEFTYKWHPTGQPLREKLVWGTEFLRNELRSDALVDRGLPDLKLKRDSRTGYGGYSYVEYFHDRHWSFGPRVDFFQNVDPTFPNSRTFNQSYSVFATYKFSEFSRLRFEATRHELLDG